MQMCKALANVLWASAEQLRMMLVLCVLNVGLENSKTLLMTPNVSIVLVEHTQILPVRQFAQMSMRGFVLRTMGLLAKGPVHRGASVKYLVPLANLPIVVHLSARTRLMTILL